eukprot:4726036-Prymnesium_polylepis.1
MARRSRARTRAQHGRSVRRGSQLPAHVVRSSCQHTLAHPATAMSVSSSRIKIFQSKRRTRASSKCATRRGRR